MANSSVTITSSSFYDREIGTSYFSSASPSSLSLEVGNIVTFSYNISQGGDSSVTVQNLDSGKWEDSNGNPITSFTLTAQQTKTIKVVDSGTDIITINFLSSSFNDKTITATITGSATPNTEIAVTSNSVFYANNTFSGFSLGPSIWYGRMANNRFYAKDGNACAINTIRYSTNGTVYLRFSHPDIAHGLNQSQILSSYTGEFFDSIVVNGTTLNFSDINSVSNTQHGTMLLFWNVGSNPMPSNGTNFNLILNNTGQDLSDQNTDWTMRPYIALVGSTYSGVNASYRNDKTGDVYSSAPSMSRGDRLRVQHLDATGDKDLRMDSSNVAVDGIIDNFFSVSGTNMLRPAAEHFGTTDSNLLRLEEGEISDYRAIVEAGTPTIDLIFTNDSSSVSWSPVLNIDSTRVTITPSATSFTEANGILGVFDVSITGGAGKDFYFDIDRISGTVGSGEIASSTIGTLSETGGSISLVLYNSDDPELEYQGENFIFKVYQGVVGSPIGPALDDVAFTIYDDDVGASFPSTVNIPLSATSHILNLTVSSGSSGVRYKLYNATGTALIQDLGILNSGSHSITISDAPATAGTSKTYTLKAANGNSIGGEPVYVSGGSYTVNAGVVPGSEDYGLELFDQLGNLYLSVTDNVAFFKFSGSGEYTPGTRVAPRTFTQVIDLSAYNLNITPDDFIYIHDRNKGGIAVFSAEITGQDEVTVTIYQLALSPNSNTRTYSYTIISTG